MSSSTGCATCTILPMVRKTVNLGGKMPQFHRDTGLLQPAGIRFALVGEHMVPGGQDQGGRDAGEIGGAQRRRAPIGDVVGMTQIMLVNHFIVGRVSRKPSAKRS